MRSHFFTLKNWVGRHEKKLSSLALFSGFILDALTLRRIDNLYENAVFAFYFLIIGFSIVAINYIEAGKYDREWVGRMHPFLLLLAQFAFGGLFSGFSIFYFRSGSLISSWPFIIILIALLIGNERLRKKYERLTFQVSFLFLTLFFFAIFSVPVVLGRMGPAIFILSGAVALILVAGFVYFLGLLLPEQVKESKRSVVYSISFIFLLVNVLYFTNLIPPIPLSLKDVGVYHSIERISRPTGEYTGDEYIAKEERHTGLSRLQVFEDVHIKKGEPLYVYSAIFAPDDINVTVVHNWRRFDPATSRWVSINRIPYTIIGGNDRGHRGYTYKVNLEEGKWRVNVETERSQVIGRVTFEVVYDDGEDGSPVLVEKVL